MLLRCTYLGIIRLNSIKIFFCFFKFNDCGILILEQCRLKSLYIQNSTQQVTQIFVEKNNSQGNTIYHTQKVTERRITFSLIRSCGKMVMDNLECISIKLMCMKLSYKQIVVVTGARSIFFYHEKQCILYIEALVKAD